MSQIPPSNWGDQPTGPDQPSTAPAGRPAADEPPDEPLDAGGDSAHGGHPEPPPGGYPAPPPAYGQPGYGDPAYGQPGYGDPAHGQAGYGPPGYGPPGYGPPAYGPPGQAPPGYGPPGYGPPGYGPPAYGPPGYGPPGQGDPAYGRSPYGQPGYAQSPYGQPYAQPYGQGPPPYGWAGATDQGPSGYPNNGTGALAGYGSRVVAYILDFLIVAIPVAILTVAAGLGRFGDYSLDAVASFGYATLLLGGPSAQTIGMRVMKIAVVGATTGTSPIGYGRAAGRAAIALLIGIIIFVGPLLDLMWPLWDRRNQTLHDKAAGTVVVRRQPLTGRPWR